MKNWIWLTFVFTLSAAEPKKVYWYLNGHFSDLEPWRMGMVVTRDGEVWVGGRSESPTNQLLFRWRDTAWKPGPALPFKARRGNMLDLDDQEDLWVCTYDPGEVNQLNLRLHHFKGGQWETTKVQPEIWPSSLDMITAHEGWLAGLNGQMLHIKDGRFQLVTIAPGRTKRDRLHIWALKMLDEERGWAVGEYGLVLRFIDGAWQTVPTPKALAQSRLNDLDVTSDGHLWVVGLNSNIARFDGGQWWPMKGPAHTDIYAIDMVRPDLGWAVGGKASILQFNGKTWSQTVSPTIGMAEHRLQDVTMVSGNSGWIVGGGVALRSTWEAPLPLTEVSQSEKYPMIRGGARMTAAVDFDNDQDLDLLLLNSEASRFYRNQGASGFLEETLLPGDPGQGRLRIGGFAVGDVEGDHDLDLYVIDSGEGKSRLFLNDGYGKLSDHTQSSLLGAVGVRDSSAFFLDNDEDSDLDLYIARGYNFSSDRHFNHLYANDGLGRFSLKEYTTHRNYSPSALWGDLDGDGDPDLVQAETEGLILYINDSGRLQRREVVAGIDPQNIGRQGALYDLDVDGDLDLIFLTNKLDVYLNDGQARFTASEDLFGQVLNTPTSDSERSGIFSLGDMNHDGAPDLLLQTVVNGNMKVQLFLRSEDGRFRDMAPMVGMSERVGRSALMSDLDDDGDLDILIGGDEQSYIFLNHRDDNNFIKVRLHGSGNNRYAVGGQVFIYDGGGMNDKTVLRGYQQLGMGHAPQNTYNLSELHFGLSGNQFYDVAAVFPSGKVVRQTSVPLGTRLDIHEHPPVIRHTIICANIISKTLRAANLPLETAKFFLVLAMLWLLRRFGPRFGASTFTTKKTTAFLAVSCYLFTAGHFAGAVGSVHGLQLVAFAGLLFVLALIDLQYGVWRNRNYMGHYRLIEPLGQGGMGVIYHARNVINRQTVALKMLQVHVLTDTDQKLRFLREASILKQLSHPNIIKVFETGEVDGRGFICMELLRGETLKDLVKDQGGLSPELAIHIFIAISDALAYIHSRDIIHRDLKSENVFVTNHLTPNPQASTWGRRVKLLDFGLSRDRSMKTMTKGKELIGTLAFMAPEQIRGEKIRKRSDIYAFGMLMYEALTGGYPFEAENDFRLMEKIRSGDIIPIIDRDPQLSSDMANIVMKCLARNIEDRFESADALQTALIRVSNGESPGLTISNPPAENPGPLKKKKLPIPSLDCSLGNGEIEALTSSWQEAFSTADVYLTAGRRSEAHAQLLSCVHILEQVLEKLDDSTWDNYVKRYEIQRVTQLLEQVQSPIV